MWKNYANCMMEYEELRQMHLVFGNNGNDGKETFTCLITWYSNTISAPPNSG